MNSGTISVLSGYRIMWLIALFDLPVLTPQERKRASKFRTFLLDEGFFMMQFSCYVRYTSGREQADAICRRLSHNVPKAGKVDILWFTDKQYANIRSFRGHAAKARPASPDQLLLF